MYHSQLRSFHAVAVHGGFSSAARQLNLSQPTISDQVRKLEDWFNVRLFERRKRSVVPTELGARLFGFAQPLCMPLLVAECLTARKCLLDAGA